MKDIKLSSFFVLYLFFCSPYFGTEEYAQQHPIEDKLIYQHLDSRYATPSEASGLILTEAFSTSGEQIRIENKHRPVIFYLWIENSSLLSGIQNNMPKPFYFLAWRKISLFILLRKLRL